jgi:hypothetical protein
MAMDAGPIDSMLSAAVGDDPALAEELRIAFKQSAERHHDLMRRARCDANWRIAAWRLKGLSSTFGVDVLIRLAEEAASGVPGDPAILRRISGAIDAV